MRPLLDFSLAPESLSRSLRGVVSRLSVGFAFFAVAAWARAEEPSTTSISREVKDVFDKSAKAVVKVRGVDEHGEFAGTGFFIDPAGTLYTAFSVGGDAESLTVEFDGKKYPARVMLTDVRSGIAILKADIATPALPLGKSEQIEVATPIITIGYPLDLPETPNFGMIAGFDRKFLGRYFSTTHLRVNVPTQRGEAGAPILNFKGEVIGILMSNIENGSACYALPIDAAEKIRNDFVRFGEARHGWIGINVAVAEKFKEGSRAEMTDIMHDTPAFGSGVKSGDILLQVGKTKVHEPEDVIDASFFITAGDTVPITVMRGDEKLTFDITADFHPASNHPPGLWPQFDPPPVIAAPSMNQSIPLRLDSNRRTP